MRAKQDAERKHMQAFVDRFRYKASKARQAQSRLKAHRQAAADRRDHRRACRALPLPRSRAAALAADRAHGRRLGRLRAGPAGAVAPRSPHRRRRPHRAPRHERQRQVDLRQAGRGRAPAGDRRSIMRAPKLKIGLFAQHQLEALEPGAIGLRTCAGADAGRAGGEGARAHRADGPRHGEDGDRRRATSPAARRRG